MAFRPPKRPEEREYYYFDFAALLASGETISSSVWSVTVVEGTDADSADLLSGAPSTSGTQISHLIIGGLNGVTYKLHCLATTSTGQKLELCEILPVENC